MYIVLHNKYNKTGYVLSMTLKVIDMDGFSIIGPFKPIQFISKGFKCILGHYGVQYYP